MMNPVANLESLYPYFESLGEGIAVLDRDGRVISINGAAARLLGLGSPKDAQAPLEEWSDAFTVSGEPIPAEEHPGRLALHGHFVRGYEAALWPKGAAKAHLVTISTASIPDEAGQTAQIIVSCREVNERRKTDETRARLAAIVESSEDAIVGKDLNGVVTAWNRGAERLFGYAAEEMIGQSIRKLLLPGDEAEEDDIMRRIGRGEIIQHSERRRRKKNGEIVEVSVTISPIRNRRGQIVGASKIARDITEARRTAGALHESQERLTRILESAMDAIITVDDRQRIQLFNTAAERMFLCSRAAALGSSLDRFLPPRFRATHSEHIRTFGSTGMTSRAMGELGSLWALRSNGEEFEIEASISQVESQGRKLFTVILRDVTERKQTEESLRQQAEMLRISQIFARGADGRIVFWPEGVQKMYGFSEEEALGAISHQLFQTRFPEPIEKIDEQLFKTGRWEGDLIHKRRDGETIVVSSAWILHRDSHGKPARVMESVVDVTEQRRANEKLLAQSQELVRQAEQLARSQQSVEEKALMLQSVLNSMCDGLVTADEQGRFVLWNAAAERILGLGPAEKPSGEWSDHYGLFLEDTVTPLPPEQNPLTIAIRGEVNHAVVFVRNQHNADGVFIDVYGTPLVDKSGAIRGGVSAFRDITERKRAEERAGQLEERFTKAFKSSPVPIAISTVEEGRIIDANDAFCKMLEYEMHEIVGRTAAELRIWAQEEQRGEVLVRLRQERRIRNLETQFATKSNARRSVILSIEIINVDGADCLLTSVFDVTETRSLERQLAQSQKMEALGQLTGGIAHDFNNLLGVVIGNLDLLERQVAWSESALKRVQTAMRAAGRGADLTRRLLAFSRREQLNPAPVVIDTAIRETVELAQRALGPEVRISTRRDPGIPPAFVDAAGLETALLNLALNARDAMPKGGTLTFSAHLADLTGANALVQAGELAPGKYVRIAVSDTGTGMSRETLERAFEPFFTTKPRDKGTGLGLAMVYGFIKQSGGAIRIYSELGYGTTVSIYLPLAEASAGEEASAPAAQTTDRIGGTALVVDDEADLLDVADAYLAELGYTVIRAADGAAALAAIERNDEIDLMVTDIIMPGGLNGIDLANQVRALRPGIKIIFTSGFPAEALSERSGKLEGGPLLHKPYLRAEFADMVRKSMSARPGMA
jgi:PAS domain S-box-containing protein